MEAEVGEAVGRADADWVREVTGYAIGGIPPIGHPAPVRTVVDEDLLRFDEVWAAAGTPRAVFPVAPRALVDAAGGTLAAVGVRYARRALGEPAQPLVPQAADVGHPVQRVAQRLGREHVARLAPLAMALDEPGVAQRDEVLGDGLAGHRQIAGEPRRGQRRLGAQRAQHRPPGRVGERGEHRARPLLGHAGTSAAVAASARMELGPRFARRRRRGARSR